MSSIVNKECIVFDIDTDSKDEVIYTLVKKLKEQNKIKDIEDFYKNVLAREAIEPTAIGHDIGLPHGRTNGVIEPAICFGRLKKPLVWSEKTGELGEVILMIAVPENDQDNTHMKIISKLARKLMHDDFRDKLLTGDKTTIYKLLKEGLEE
ncbi:PTS fructose transporter subunit IIABC [Erysipelotrichaceae bacterium MTC7]|nr:PTS fructose transporter subunit IIABC [Erysipelotrichaceae bacterium MTC7]